MTNILLDTEYVGRLKERVKELEAQLAERCPDIWGMQIQNCSLVHENLDLKAQIIEANNHVVLTDLAMETVNADNRKLREALIEVPAAMTARQVSSWLDTYENLRWQALKDGG